MTYTPHDIEWTDEKVRRLWDYYGHASAYQEIYFSKVCGEVLLRRAGLNLSSMRLLDFGCGPGHMMPHVQRLFPGCEYHGLDFSFASTEAAKLKGRSYPVFKHIELVDTLPTPYKSAFFDVVLLIEVVEHLDDRHSQDTFSEISRITRKGGLLCVTTPNNEDLETLMLCCPDCGARYHMWQHLRSWSARTMQDCVSGYGFKLVRKLEDNLRPMNPIERMAYWILTRLRKGTRRPHLLCVFERI